MWQHKLFALPILLISLVLGACDGDGPTDPKEEELGGVYSAVSARGPTLSTSPKTMQLPAVLYDGPVRTDDGTVYEVRYELSSATLVLAESNSSYRYEGTFRLTSKTGQFATATETAREEGTYIRWPDGDIDFIEKFDSDIYLDASGTVDDGRIVVGVDDPILNENYILRFEK